MDKTIKEVADELGVSKDKVRYRVSKLPTELVCKIDDIYYIKEQGIERIAKELGVQLHSKLHSVKEEKLHTNAPLHSEITYLNIKELEYKIELLENENKLLNNNIYDLKNSNEIISSQIKIKDEQINNKDKQIENLTKLINQQQTLALIDKKKEDEETEIKDTKEEVKEENKVSDPVQKKSFWSKLFGRK